jgi:poly(A) polymerase Pap1
MLDDLVREGIDPDGVPVLKGRRANEILKRVVVPAWETFLSLLGFAKHWARARSNYGISRALLSTYVCKKSPKGCQSRFFDES